MKKMIIIVGLVSLSTSVWSQEALGIKTGAANAVQRGAEYSGLSLIGSSKQSTAAKALESGGVGIVGSIFQDYRENSRAKEKTSQTELASLHSGAGQRGPGPQTYVQGQPGVGQPTAVVYVQQPVPVAATAPVGGFVKHLYVRDEDGMMFEKLPDGQLKPAPGFEPVKKAGEWRIKMSDGTYQLCGFEDFSKPAPAPAAPPK